MADAPVRVALLFSLILHAGLWAIPVPASRGPADTGAQPGAPSRSDFWGGKTFEAPELLGPGTPDPGQGTAPGQTTAPEHAPRPRPAPTKGGAPGHTTAAATSGGSMSGSGAGSYGAEVAEPGTRDLLRSFVRALPPAISADPVWASLPLGPAASADVTLAIDDEGKVRLVDRPPDAPPVPPVIASILRRTLILLASGRFALDPRQAQVGTEPVRISVSITQQEPPSERELISGGAFGLGSEAPTDATPGRAYFTLASGRHVDVVVRRTRPGH